MNERVCGIAAACLFVWSNCVGAANEPGTDSAEAHLMEWPAFGPVFDDVILAWCGVPGWEALNARWTKNQSRDKRWSMLRGMLAERQGLLDEAAARYAESGDEDWAHYHRGRLKAFLGDVEGGKRELRVAALQAKHVKVFELAAVGLGEIAMLQKGMTEAGKVYLELWEKRPQVQMRQALLEPLLSVLAERNAASAWLEKLRPGAADRKLQPATRAAHALLWLRGNYLLNGVWALTPDLTDALTMAGAEEAALLLLPNLDLSPRARMTMLRMGPSLMTGLSGDLSNRTEITQKIVLPAVDRVARAGRAADSVLAFWLRSLAAKGAKDLSEGAIATRQRLRERPLLLASACGALTTRDAAREVGDVLSREVFQDLDKTEWQAMRLWLRLRSGENPEQLRDSAAHLWHLAQVDERFSYFSDLLDGGKWPGSITAFSSTANDPGTLEPSPEVIWNLRGKAFSERMAARFCIRLGQTLARTTGSYWPTFNYSDPGTVKSLRDSPPAIERIPSGAQLRKQLWEWRASLGLDAAILGAVDDRDVPLADRITDALLTTSTKNAATAIKGMSRLDKAPTSLLMALLNNARGSLPGISSTDGEGQSLRQELFNQLSDALVRQHPDWILDALIFARPLAKVPSLSMAQKDELMLLSPSYANTDFRSPDESEQSQREDNLKTIFPDLADANKRAFAMLELRQRFGLSLVPHPLAGLEWKPSLVRDTNLLRIATVRSRQPILGAKLSDSGRGSRPMPMMMSGRPGTFGEVGGLISEEYGDQIFRPAPDREVEMRSMAGHFRIVDDYLAMWSAVAGAGETARGFNPEASAAALKLITECLDKAKSGRAKFALAVLHQYCGDQTKAKELAAGLKSREGPAGRLAEIIEHPPTAPEPRPETLARIEMLTKEREERAIAKVREALESPMDLDGIDEGAIYSDTLRRLVPDSASRTAVYEWLKRETKGEARFAAHARILAALARELKRPGEEIKSAEDLDLKLNADIGWPWLHRALDYAAEGDEKFALDMFFEAVRRTDFGRSPNYVWRYPPKNESWLDRVASADRMSEFSGALVEGLEKTAPGAAAEIAAMFALRVFASPDKPRNVATINRLMKVITERQPQLFIFQFQEFGELVTRWSREQEDELAVKLARAMLLSPWPDEFERRKSWDYTTTNGIPQGRWQALDSWESHDEASGGGPIVPLITKAIQMDSADFLASCEKVARDHPWDEQVISCALVCRARAGRLADESLHLTEGLPDEARMRVARRLCEFAPTENLSLAALTPLLEGGLRSVLSRGRGKEYDFNRSRYPVLMALRVTPWLEKAGATRALEGLLPLLREMLPDADLGWIDDEVWGRIGMLNARYGNDEERRAFMQRWRANIFGRIQKFSKDDEAAAAIANSAEAALVGGTERGETFLSLAGDLWQELCEQFGGKKDPDAHATALLSEALLALGDDQRIAAFDATLEKMIRYSAEPGLKEVQRGFRLAKALLSGDDSRLPAISAWLQHSGNGKSAPKVHWEFVVPTGDETLQAGGLFRRREIDTEDRRTTATRRSSSGQLRRLNGRYDVEIYAGASPDALRPVARLAGAASEGSVEIADMPAAGWLRAVVKSPRTGTVNLGDSIVYSTQPALLSTDPDFGRAARPAGEIPVWPALAVGQFGQPLTAPAALAGGTEYLLTIDRSSAAAARQIELVALDGKRQPLGVWPPFGSGLWDLTGSGTGERQLSWRFRPDEWIAADGFLRPRTAHEGKQGVAPAYIIFAVRGDHSSDVPRAELRTFRTTARQGEDQKLPMLQPELLAPLGFAPTAWHLSDHFPRAAFVGMGQLVVFDTQGIPWKPLARMSSKNLTGSEWPLIFANDLVQCVEQGINNQRKAGWRIIHVLPDADYDASERRDCPFEFTHVEFSPFEDVAILMMGTGGLERSRHLRVAWLGTTGLLANLDLERPRWPPYTTSPKVLWWGKDGAMALHEYDVHYQLRKAGGAFSLAKLSPGGPKLEESPKNATLGTTMLPDRWALKNPTLLVESDRQSGGPIRGFRLPVACEGAPMHLSDNSPLILRTTKHDLIQVKPEGR